MPAGDPAGYNVPGDPNSGVKPGPDDAAQGLQAIQEAMMSIAEGAKGAGMPPEALQKLDEAQQAYSEFLDLISGSAPKGGPVAPEMAGTGAVPVR